MKKMIISSEQGSAYYYDEDEYNRVDRMTDPQEIAIAAIAYNYGISRQDAQKEYETISEDKLKEFLSYYFRRDIPMQQKNRYKKSADADAQDILNAIKVVPFCDYFNVAYPEKVVGFDEYVVPRWWGENAVSYFGYDKLADMVEEIKDEMNMDCKIAGNGDLYIFE